MVKQVSNNLHTHLDVAFSDLAASKEMRTMLNGDSAAGTVAGGSTVTVAEDGIGPLRQTVITMAATPITLTDEAVVVLYGGIKLYDMPAGNIIFLGAVLNATTATGGGLIAAADGDVGVGTVTASNNATLTLTEQNIIPSTAIAQTVSNAGPIDAQSTGVTVIDGTATAADVFLNVLWDDTDHNGGTMTVTGTLTLTWINLGDN